MKLDLSLNELDALLKALEHECDRQNDFAASLPPDTAAHYEARQKAITLMRLFDGLARQGGYK